SRHGRSDNSRRRVLVVNLNSPSVVWRHGRVGDHESGATAAERTRGVPSAGGGSGHQLARSSRRPPGADARIGKRLSLVTMVATASMAFAGCSSAPNTPEPASTVGQPSPSTLPSRVSAAIATEHGPENFYVTKDGLYVGNHRGGTIQRIDLATNRTV